MSPLSKIEAGAKLRHPSMIGRVWSGLSIQSGYVGVGAAIHREPVRVFFRTWDGWAKDIDVPLEPKGAA